MLASIRNTETDSSTSRTRRLARALVLAAGLALAATSAAAAEAPVFGPPSQEEVAVLRALLGVAPQPVAAPVVIDEASVPALDQATAPAQTEANAASTTSVTAAATSAKATAAGSPDDLQSSTILEANASSGHLLLASR